MLMWGSIQLNPIVLNVSVVLSSTMKQKGSGKKRRIEMETETLYDVMITQLEAAEVVEQPRWAQ